MISKHLNALNNSSVAKKNHEQNKSQNLNKSVENQHQNFEIDNSNSPTSSALFVLNDESNITVTSEWMNRSSHHVDCSVMDLEPLDESINQAALPVTTSVTSTTSKFNLGTKPSLKTLTSTVSAQRTHSVKNLASTIPGELMNPAPKPTVKFQLPVDQSHTNNSVLLDNSLIAGGCDLEEPRLSSASSNQNAALNASSSTNAFEFSRKIAEYFVAKQAFLLENNEHDALNPIELHQKLDELIAHDSTFSEAYYLKYLNYLRLKDYPSALKSLHDYFDRLLLAGSVSLAALNLCSLEYRFENRENALFALKEAITSAHQEGDLICLQHCLVN